MLQHDLHKYVTLRNLLSADVPVIMEIENSSYEFPWTQQIFYDCLNSDYHCFGVELYGDLAGYIIVSEILDEAHLLNICFAQKWRNQGLGKVTISWVFKFLAAKNIKQLFLEVRPSNLNALALYDRLGFEVIGIRKDYYPAEQGREDALAMMKNLG